MDWDKAMNIRTWGIREWPQGVYDYHRSEATEYPVIEMVLRSMGVQAHDRLVDFGAGSGRVIFFAHQLYGIHTTGVELHPETYDELESNWYNYTGRFPSARQHIRILERPAQHYEVEPEDTLFYFFNPFTLPIVKAVVFNIIRSLWTFPRRIRIAFYYPDRDVEDFLASVTELRREEPVKVDQRDVRGYYVIYSSREEFMKGGS